MNIKKKQKNKNKNHKIKSTSNLSIQKNLIFIHIKENYFKNDAKILLVHSGGLQGNRSVKPGVLLF